MSAQTAVTTTSPPSLLAKFAARFGVEPNKMMNTLKATAFRQRDGAEVSNEQMMALLIVADQYGLNPWTKEIYAFPDKANGIVPVVGIDGWSRIINTNPQFDGINFASHGDGDTLSVTCTIWRKDRAHPTAVTEYLSECKRPTQPWTSHPRRMLRHKAMAQCARIAFGYVGIYDEDEAQRIIESSGHVVAEESPRIAAINEKIKGATVESEPAAAAAPMTAAAWYDALNAIDDADDLDAHRTLIEHYPEAERENMRREADARFRALTE